jgi:hypothetical protein
MGCSMLIERKTGCGRGVHGWGQSETGAVPPAPVIALP